MRNWDYICTALIQDLLKLLTDIAWTLQKAEEHVTEHAHKQIYFCLY